MQWSSVSQPDFIAPTAHTCCCPSFYDTCIWLNFPKRPLWMRSKESTHLCILLNFFMLSEEPEFTWRKPSVPSIRAVIFSSRLSCTSSETTSSEGHVNLLGQEVKA